MKYSTIIKKIAALSLSAVLAVGALTACSGSDTANEDNVGEKNNATYRTVDEIKQSGKVIIGVFSDKAPFGYVDENGSYQGYDVYFAERIAKDLGVDVEYVSTDPASRVEYAATGKVDIILANFTVTEERAEKVDFALPYMKVKLGVVSPDTAVVRSIDDLKDKTLIVVKGTTAETYFEKNEPDVKLQKYDEYADAYNALLQGRGDAFSTDNTEVLAWALVNPGYTVGIDALGNADTIAPAVQKGNTSLLNWLNDEIKSLGNENFFHADYDATLASVYGAAANPDSLVVEGGVVD
ncbi:MAG: cysteine ABC transporter substrate-binding protein [Clostridia bacterium]|nr:cysteine ABC transporter substrate-binding protein [Clostridia bacterium]